MYAPVEKMSIKIKRVYDPADRKDGLRRLVDRLWPRGLSKEDVRIDLWLKSIAPSSELRKWYGHDPAKWPEFKKRYSLEPDSNYDAVKALRRQIKNGCVSFFSNELQYNNAAALKEYHLDTIAKQEGTT